MQRLSEFGDADPDMVFASSAERDREFAWIFSELVRKNEAIVQDMVTRPKHNVLSALEKRLASSLIGKGFIEVRTPIIISKASLGRMTVTEDSELYGQVFPIDTKRCLRPMLAPNLYTMMRKLRSRTDGPVRIFEIGPCFRKESKSGEHLEQFTMLNLVELGPPGDPADRLNEHIATVMGAAGLKFTTSEETSEVYGRTLDVIVNGTEIASGAVGPHPLDGAHKIYEPWCGIGFGMERMLMSLQRKNNIRKAAASLTYLNGERIS